MPALFRRPSFWVVILIVITVGSIFFVMSGQAKKFTTTELKDLASYISSLPGELKTVPDTKFHHAK